MMNVGFRCRLTFRFRRNQNPGILEQLKEVIR